MLQDNLSQNMSNVLTINIVKSVLHFSNQFERPIHIIILYNYFDSPTKSFSDFCPVKFLDTLRKRFCRKFKILIKFWSIIV